MADPIVIIGAGIGGLQPGERLSNHPATHSFIRIAGEKGGRSQALDSPANVDRAFPLLDAHPE